jgi:general secretion pathway protein K
MHRWWDPCHDERGVALLVTLLVVTPMAVVVLDLNYLTRVEVHSAANFRDQSRACYLAKSGVTLASELLRRNVPELAELKRHLLAGLPQTLPVGEDVVTVRVVDEQGKIHLNSLVQATATAPPIQGRPGAQAAEPPRTWIDITQDLFQRLRVDPTIVGAIVDWIDADDFPTGPGGAESQYYRALEKPYVVRNAPMETIAELSLIRGVTDELLLTLGAKRLGGIVDPATNAYLTVLPSAPGDRWQVNLNTAPLPILQSLTREVGTFAELIVERRSQRWITNMAELQEIGITGTALQDFQQWGTLSSTYFTVHAQGTMGEVTSQITALIQTLQGQGSPNSAGGLAESPPSQSLAGGIPGGQAPTGGSFGSQSQTAGTQGTKILSWRAQ